MKKKWIIVDALYSLGAHLVSAEKKWTSVDTLYFLGALLVSAGTGLLLPAAGLITAGCFALLASVLVEQACAEGRAEGSAEQGEESDVEQ